MTLFDRITLLLTSPEEATYDLYNSPNLAQGFFIVSIYAGVSGLNTFLSAIIATESFAFSLVSFLGSFLLVYATWVILAIVFRLIAAVLGGLGEIPSLLTGTGFAAAPMILTACCSLIFTMIGREIFEDDPDKMIEKIRLVISLVGMIWGWPGILCYFSLKHSEKLHPVKAILITTLAFFGMALLEIMQSNAF